MARVLPTQDREVQKIMGERIEREWQAKARNSGELFKEEVPDDRTGRLIEKYHGDINEAFRPFKLPAIPFQLAKVVHFKGEPYLANQVPPHIERAMILAKAGFSE